MDLATRKVLDDRDTERREQPRLGRRQRHVPVRREGSGNAARLPRAQASLAARLAEPSPRIRSVWEQKDDSFYTSVYRTKDEKYLVIHTQSTVSSEVWFADATIPKLEFKLFLPRERDHEYQVEHANGRWIVRTNWQAKNFRIVAVKPGDEGDRAQVAGRRRASRRCVRRRLRRRAQLPHRRGAFRRTAQAAHPPVERRRRTCSSPPTSPATRWRSTSIASSTATRCATRTPRW